jgi:hypothetical protein
MVLRLALVLSIVVAMIAATSAQAEPPVQKSAPNVEKGFWRILVKPKSRWVLADTIDRSHGWKIVVETYDVRKVGGADVARLRWTHVGPKGQKEPWSAGPYTHVAVTDAGLYLLSDEADDAKIVEALKRKPSRSDPPKPYRGTKQNGGRFLRIDGGEVCVGEEPLPGAGECDDVCEAEMCISSTRGVVKLSGYWAPNKSIYEAE